MEVRYLHLIRDLIRPISLSLTLFSLAMCLRAEMALTACHVEGNET